MNKYLVSYFTVIAIAHPVSALSNDVTQMQTASIQSGKNLWNKQFDFKGQQRSCTSCHTSNPEQSGKHLRTGKNIKPMAVSTNPDRFTDAAKSAKWFKRNCKWTLGRECTAHEKSAIIHYLSSI